jgi:hypothetical protein
MIVYRGNGFVFRYSFFCSFSLLFHQYFSLSLFLHFLPFINCLFLFLFMFFYAEFILRCHPFPLYQHAFPFCYLWRAHADKSVRKFEEKSYLFLPSTYISRLHILDQLICHFVTFRTYCVSVVSMKYMLITYLLASRS